MVTGVEKVVPWQKKIMRKEKWRMIPGYDGLYMVSSLGRVKNCRTGRIMSPSDNGRGYLQIGLTKNGIRKTYKVHRLVAMAFIPNPNNLPEVNHINEDKTDNRVENLEWCTHAYNTGYGDRSRKVREKTTNGKLSTPVIQIKPNGERIEYPSMQEAERQTKVPQANISKVCNGDRRKAGGCRWKFKSLSEKNYVQPNS